MIDPQSVPHLPGVPVLDVDGDIIGSVERIYIHQDTGAPLWVAIHTHIDGAENVLAPLEDARFDDQPGSALHIALPRATVDDAPPIESIDTLTRDDVHALRNYYNPTTLAPTPGVDDAASSAGIDVVRFEEQLRVSTIAQPKERVRFQKVIVTEEKTITVTVRREELRMIREPLTDMDESPTSPHTSSTGDFEIVLHEERILISTDVIPTERVRVTVSPVIDQLPVTDTVRKEQVDIHTTTT